MYSVYDREFLGIKHIRHHVDDKKLTIFTDHKPFCTRQLQRRFNTPDMPPSLLFIAELSTDIQHITGKDNVVADALSRPITFAIWLPSIDYRQLLKASLHARLLNAAWMDKLPFVLLCIHTEGRK